MLNTKYYSYIVARDFGFAPNPFGTYFTLATCKPKIRKGACIGDWVFGTSSVAKGMIPKLVFAMRVTEKTSFNEYFQSPKFAYKKPVMNGSLKKMYGDNIYHSTKENGQTIWNQLNSHHSLADGKVNIYNLKRDTGSTDKVLVSDDFYYFGKSAIVLPNNLIDKIRKKGPGQKYVKPEYAEKLIEYLKSNFDKGLHDDPKDFNSSFKRYDGKS